jgi:hypothetical protein
MTRIFLSSRLFTLAVFALGAVASSPTEAQTDVLVVNGTSVGVLATTQTLKTCVSSSPRTSANPQPVRFTVVFHGIYNSAGELVLRGELRVPVGGFQCVDVPYAELVAAGLEPDPRTGAITFRIDILSQRGSTDEGVGSNQTRTVGAVMSVDAATGKIETYHGWTSPNFLFNTSP